MNMNELLYMAHMKDTFAIEELLLEVKNTIDYEVNRQLLSFQSMGTFRDDLTLEAQIAVLRGIENYRDDRNCSFRTFVSVIVRRRIAKIIHQTVFAAASRGITVYSIDSENDETPSYSNLIRNNDPMADPVFRMYYNDAKDRLNSEVLGFTNGEKGILDSWIEGGTYEMRCEKLGLTYRQYEGRLRRVKKKVMNAIKE